MIRINGNRAVGALTPRVECASGVGLVVADDNLAHRLIEEFRHVTERQPALAFRRAAIGFAVGAAVDHDGAVVRSFHFDVLLGQHGAALVDDDEIGRAVALAGETVSPPGWTVMSAMSGLPTTTLRRGPAVQDLAWSSRTTMVSPAAAGGRHGTMDAQWWPPAKRPGLASPRRRRTTPPSKCSETLRGTQHHRRAPQSIDPIDCKLVNEVQIVASRLRGDVRRDRLTIRQIRGCRVI